MAAAIGAFPTLVNSVLRRPNVIYRAPSTAPTTGTSIPVSRLPVAPKPTPLPIPPPTDIGPWELPPSRLPTPLPLAPTGGTTTGTGTTTTSTTPGTTTGAGSGGGGGTDSRLLDLLAGAFKPQDISQPYGPIASGPVQMPGSESGGGGGINPALIILAFVAIVGVMWWMNRQGKRKAA